MMRRGKFAHRLPRLLRSRNSKPTECGLKRENVTYRFSSKRAPLAESKLARLGAITTKLRLHLNR